MAWWKARSRSWWSRVVVLLVAATAGGLLGGAAAPAAVPDVFGFVLWNGSATVPSATWPAGSTVLAGASGRYKVTFPGQAAAQGVAHVTAVNTGPVWCQLDSWSSSGPDEVVLVACYKAGGLLAPSGFTVLFDSSSGGLVSTPARYGYLDTLPNGTIVSQYSSGGLASTVTHVATGQWTIKMPGLGTTGPLDGSGQATAVNVNTPARCKAQFWSSNPAMQQGTILCFDATGAPLDTRFTATYQYQRSLYGAAAPPKHFGYVDYGPPLGPPSTNFNSVLGGGVNTLVNPAIGVYSVTFPSLAVLPDTIAVESFGPGSDFCNLGTPWGHTATDTVVRNINCYTNVGVPVNAGFLISDNSAF